MLTIRPLLDARLRTRRDQVRRPGDLPRGGHVVPRLLRAPRTVRLTRPASSPGRATSARVKAAGRCPTQELYSYLKKFGLGEPTGLGFPGETTGRPAAAELAADRPATPSRSGRACRSTRCSSRASIATIANGGVRVQPSLVDGYVDPDGHGQPAADPPAEHRVVSADTARRSRQMLEAVVGPEARRRRRDPGYRVAGKTGTAQRVDPTAAATAAHVSRSSASPRPTTRGFVVSVVAAAARKRGNDGGVDRRPGVPDLMAASRCSSAESPPTGTRARALPVDVVTRR